MSIKAKNRTSPSVPLCATRLDGGRTPTHTSTSGEMEQDMDEKEEKLDWAWGFWNQCRARKEPNSSGYWGRCELKPHGPEVHHALERGFDTPRWSTEWTA